MDKVHFSTGKDDWETPQWLFNQLDDEFHFTLDPCCTAENAKCRKYYVVVYGAYCIPFLPVYR